MGLGVVEGTAGREGGGEQQGEPRCQPRPVRGAAQLRERGGHFVGLGASQSQPQKLEQEGGVLGTVGIETEQLPGLRELEFGVEETQREQSPDSTEEFGVRAVSSGAKKTGPRCLGLFAASEHEGHRERRARQSLRRRIVIDQPLQRVDQRLGVRVFRQ